MKYNSSSSFVKNSDGKPIQRFCILDPTSRDRVPRGVCALAIMTKAPEAGRVKTRLVPPLTPEEAAELNRCFLRDTAVAISSPSCYQPVANGGITERAVGVAVYTPVGAELAYTDILPADFSLLPQRGDEFGERLHLAVEDLFKCGFAAVCMIDSDSPTVPAENFAQAVELLSVGQDRVVLGPSDDGGYYLIGLKKPDRHLFEQIDWSTERVFGQTMQRATEIGLEIKLLPTGYDVDDAASLRRLCDELLAEDAAGGVAPNTRKFLESIAVQDKL